MLLGVIQTMKNGSAKFNGFVVHPNILQRFLSIMHEAVFIFNFIFSLALFYLVDQ